MSSLDERWAANETASRMALLTLVSQVEDLSHWEPVGAFIEDVRMALSEGGCVAHTDLARVARWANRWTRLDRRLRALYASALQDPDVRWAAEAGMWAILKGGPTAKGSVYAVLRNRWQELYNEPPSIEIIPIRLVHP